MATQTVFQRHEKKFLMDEDVVRTILPEIEKHMVPDQYCSDGRCYTISNLYYDTPLDDVIRESLEKPFYKEKLRMRSYGIPHSINDPVFLEIKKKIDGTVTKRRAKLTYGEAEMFLYQGIYPQREDYMTRQVLREVDYYLSHKKVYASTRISYDRIAYYDRENPNFRLTIDENLRYLKGDKPDQGIVDSTERGVIPGGVDFRDSREGKRLLQPHLRLMEVKVSDAYPLWFSRLLCTEGIRRVSFSKYGVSYKKELMEELHLDSEGISILSHI